MNQICYIIGAGEDYGLDFTLREGDLLLAADGGYARVKKAGLCPDLVIGDFDSLGAAPEGEETVLLPTVKDVTDTWAAVEIGLKRGYQRFHLYGCTGGRFDHTLANLQTVADLTERGCECRLVDKTQIVTGLHNGSLAFGPEQKGFLSVFAHSDTCTGVTLKGLKYELDKADLSNRFPLGVSNEFLGVPSSVSVEKGTAILVFDR